MRKAMRLPTSERRKQIVQAGLELCRRYGISSLRTEKIARKIGVTPGALFRHFPSKAAILRAMADELLDRLERATPPDDLPPWAWIEAFVMGRVRILKEDPEVRLLFSDGFLVALPEEAQDDVHRAFLRAWERLNERIRAAQAQGRVRADLEAHELAAAVVGLVQAVLHPPLADLPEWNTPEAVWATTQDLLTVREPAARS
ncbi:regulatory protein TetR [Oceanithermus profundus DSM 14977]|uniref:Regulatory protein TetR n=1 Tax=Oceanithermus profundus (strain DSM 14977 / NBRC 100410 / VKM B-2274 / 506) TaxID=670487 RepID=E4U6X4_OCEP5|nr:TetR/AcrR family transcriptional regulator [Oceanithermus profundus]ADR35977.1 regulatory protein TetR [Oceanithermus profundus DSM 14977]